MLSTCKFGTRGAVCHYKRVCQILAYNCSICEFDFFYDFPQLSETRNLALERTFLSIFIVIVSEHGQKKNVFSSHFLTFLNTHKKRKKIDWIQYSTAAHRVYRGIIFGLFKIKYISINSPPHKKKKKLTNLKLKEVLMSFFFFSSIRFKWNVKYIVSENWPVTRSVDRPWSPRGNRPDRQSRCSLLTTQPLSPVATTYLRFPTASIMAVIWPTNWLLQLLYNILNTSFRFDLF